MKHTLAGLLALFCLAAALTGCAGGSAPTTSGQASADGKYEQTTFAMDTLMTLTAYGEGAQAAVNGGISTIAAIENRLSASRECSEIYAINRGAGATVSVSPETLALVQRALDIGASTDGALDIAIYPIMQAWGFTDKNYRVPSQEELDALLSKVDEGAVQLGSDDITLPDGMGIDLGAIAKGYTSQTLADDFRTQGITSAIVTLGGNVQAVGNRPDGTPWRVGIQDPQDPEGVFGVLSLTDSAAVTSGGYQRYFEQDAVTYHHIIDSTTGTPAANGILSSTIVCEDGTLADGLSTALFVMGTDKAVQYWREQGGFEAVLVTDDNRVLITSGLKDRFSEYGNIGKYTYEFIE